MGRMIRGTAHGGNAILTTFSATKPSSGERRIRRGTGAIDPLAAASRA